MDWSYFFASMTEALLGFIHGTLTSTLVAQNVKHRGARHLQGSYERSTLSYQSANLPSFIDVE